MRHIHVLRLAGFALGLLALSTAASAQSDEKPFPAEARKRLDYGIGSWRSDTEYLTPQGKVHSTAMSEDTREFVIEDRVVEITGIINGGESKFRAWEYYDVAEGKYTLTSVNRNGQLWSMKGDLGEEFSWTASRTNSNGETVLMKFTHIDVKRDSFMAIGEISKDGGKTWWTFQRQSMTRTK